MNFPKFLGLKLPSRYALAVNIDNTILVYYDPVAKISYNITAIENISGLQRLKSHDLRRIAFRSNGCSCVELTCSCCLGIKFTQLNIAREGCMNFTYDPYEFAVISMMSINENIIFSNTFSAKNPPPLCLPVVIPYIPIQIETCAKIYNIYTPGQNIHICFDFETHIQKATLFVLRFDCIRMGYNGIALLKPDDMGGISTSTEEQSYTDVYDEVTEIKYKKFS